MKEERIRGFDYSRIRLFEDENNFSLFAFCGCGYGEEIVGDLEMDFVVGKLEGVGAGGVVLVVGTGVVGEDGAEGVLLLGGEDGEKGFGIVDGEGRLLLRLGGETTGGVGMGVGEGEVGFDVVDRGAVHKVGAGDVEDRALGCGEVYLGETHRGETDGIGAERRACGEDAHTPVTAETGRTDGGMPLFGMGLREVPEKPDMGETL